MCDTLRIPTSANPWRKDPGLDFVIKSHTLTVSCSLFLQLHKSKKIAAYLANIEGLSISYAKFKINTSKHMGGIPD